MSREGEAILVVTGSRCWLGLEAAIYVELNGFAARHPGKRITLFVGDCKTRPKSKGISVDQAAATYARRIGWTVKVFRAFWADEGKAAGPKRNMRMIDEACDKEDDGATVETIAFLMPTGKGTRHCRRYSESQGIATRSIYYEAPKTDA